MHQLVVTLDCPDRPGIVHAITAGIVAAGGNITELQQFSSPDSGHFFTRIEVDGSESDELTRAIAETTAGFDARLRVDDAQKRVVPLTEWLGGLKHDVKPQLDAARRLGELAGNTPAMVLVVDDDSFQSKLLERLLGNAGYRTMAAHSGAEALALIARQNPDLILMDVALPDLNGIEITRRLKASPRTAAIPIVMITGHSERQVLEASLKAGAVDFLVKPFDREVLLQKITHHLTH